MGRNVDVKLRVEATARLRKLIARVADRGPETFSQDDTFFPAPRGRLKLRKLAPDRGELIAYQRADAAAPRESSYRIAETRQPDEMREVLAAALDTAGRVRKQRTLYLVGQTRVHLDAVEGLGSFMELEVVLRPQQTEEEGVAIARDLMGRLEVSDAVPVPVAYVDLLAGDRPSGDAP